MGISQSLVGIIFVVFLGLYFLTSAIKVLKEYERGVIFRLGRVIPVKGPGLIIIIPVIDKIIRVSLRTITMDVPPQDIITQDNVSVKVNAVVYFRVMEPLRSRTSTLLQARLPRPRSGAFSDRATSTICYQNVMRSMPSFRGS